MVLGETHANLSLSLSPLIGTCHPQTWWMHREKEVLPACLPAWIRKQFFPLPHFLLETSMFVRSLARIFSLFQFSRRMRNERERERERDHFLGLQHPPKNFFFFFSVPIPGFRSLVPSLVPRCFCNKLSFPSSLSLSQSVSQAKWCNLSLSGAHHPSLLPILQWNKALLSFSLSLSQGTKLILETAKFPRKEQNPSPSYSPIRYHTQIAPIRGKGVSLL